MVKGNYKLPSIRNRFIGLLVIVFSVFLFITIYDIVETRKHEIGEIRSQTKELVRFVKGRQKEYITEARQLLYLLAQLKNTDFSPGGFACYETLKGILATNSQFANIGYIANDGYLLCSALPLAKEVWLDDRDYFRYAIKNRDFSMGQYQVGRVTGKSSINFGYPAIDSQGSVKGVYFVALDLEQLSNDIVNMDLPTGTSITILDKKGRILARYPEQEMLGGNISAWSEIGSQIIKASDATFQIRDRAGKNYLYTSSKMIGEREDIYVLAGIPSHLAYARVNAVFLQRMGILSLFAVLIGAIAWRWSNHQFLKPLQALIKVSDRLSKGELNARTDILVNTLEFNHLAVTFDSMAKSLEDRYNKSIRQQRRLKRLNRALNTLSAGNKALIRATDEQALLQDMCNIAIKFGEYRLAWIGYAEHDKSRSIKHKASAGVDREFFDNRPISWSEQAEVATTTGYAIRVGQPCLMNDIQEITEWSQWKDYCEKRGIKSGIAMPLMVDGVNIGAFTIYSTSIDAFTESERSILEEMVEDLSFGIKTLRIRKQHKEAEEVIHRMAFYDSLTQFPNHIYLEELISNHLKNDQVCKAALIIVGLNRFKDINTTLGFQVGNRILKKIGDRIKPLLNEHEALARMRGDEFAVFIPDTNIEVIKTKAKEIMEVIEKPYSLDGFTLNVSARAGIAMLPDHCGPKEELVRSADVALQYAKQRHRRYMLYSTEDDNQKKYLFSLAEKLHTALQNRELTLYYQPKISMKTDKIIGVEALARWFLPSGEIITPDVFIPLAESTGMINALSQWVLESALNQTVNWQQIGINLPIAINFSARNLYNPYLLSFIDQAIKSRNIEPGLLEIEITESTIMEDLEHAALVLAQIKEMGIPLYIDDFGTGHSSLVTLKKLPMSSLKIDKSFVMDLLSDGEAAVIVKSTINLAHDMGLAVVAEGVENEKIWQKLKNLGCDSAQGYFMGKPMAAAQILNWVHESRFGLDRANIIPYKAKK